MDLQKITDDIINAGEVVLKGKRATYEEIVIASVDLTNAFADLHETIDVKCAEIGSAQENKDLPNNKVERKIKDATIKERALLKKVEGFKKSIGHMEYRESK